MKAVGKIYDRARFREANCPRSATALLLDTCLLAVYGQWQRQGEVCHLIARHLVDLTPLLGRLVTESRDFR